VSNALAIATLSAVLRARVEWLVDTAGMSGFAIVTGPPGPEPENGVYIHLYQVVPDADLRNRTLPERDATGAVARPPRVALDLCYAFTFVGQPDNQDAERLAGLVVGSLHETARVSPAEIADFVTTLPNGHALGASDLANQAESIRLTMLPLDLEDLSRLWSANPQSTPRLTVAYRAAVVMVDAQVRAGTGLPVTREPAVTTIQLRRPQLTGVASSARSQPVVRFGEDLVLTGTALLGDPTLVLVGGQQLPPAAGGRDTELRVPVSDASGLRPGLGTVQVRHDVTLTDGTTRPGPETGMLPVALVPGVATATLPTRTGVDADGGPTLTVRLVLDPEPLAAEAYTVLLNGPDGTRTEWPGVRVAPAVAGDPVVLEAVTSGLPAGRHLVRVLVGGAVSLLDADPLTGDLTGPAVTAP
jgi:hypothetical protein